jgi:hypothetical protein
MHRISDFRMGGISTRNFKMFRQLCGDSTLKNVVIVTNMWSEVSKEVGEARETELASQDLFFKPVLSKGALMLRHENNKESAQNVLRHIVENHPLSLQIQRELVDQKKDISQTAAGEELNRELMQQIKRHREEMRKIQEEMRGISSFQKTLTLSDHCARPAEAIRMKDEETKRELEIETRKLQNEVSRVQTDAQKLVSEYSEEKIRLEKRMQELAESSRQEAARAREDYNRQMLALQNRLDETSASSSAERSNLLRQMEELGRFGNLRSGGGGGLFVMIGRALDGVFGF